MTNEQHEAVTVEAMHAGTLPSWLTPAAATPSPAVTEVTRLKAVVAALVDEHNAANARAEEAEAKLARVDEYGESQWDSGWRWDDARRPEDKPVSFAEWLAQRVGETAADVAEWLKPATAALEANAWQRQNDPRAVQP